MVAKARAWGALAEAHGVSLPAVALAFCALPECVGVLPETLVVSTFGIGPQVSQLSWSPLGVLFGQCCDGETEVGGSYRGDAISHR